MRALLVAFAVVLLLPHSAKAQRLTALRDAQSMNNVQSLTLEELMPSDSSALTPAPAFAGYGKPSPVPFVLVGAATGAAFCGLITDFKDTDSLLLGGAAGAVMGLFVHMVLTSEKRPPWFP